MQFSLPIARAFMDAVKSGQFESAMDLVSADYERRLRENRPAGSKLGSVFREAILLPLVQKYQTEQSALEKLVGYDLTSSQLAPNKDEVVHEGVITMNDGKVFHFRLLVRFDKQSEKWRVDAMVITP